MTIRVRPRSKYGAVKATVDGIRFDSKRESARYQELKLLEQAGEIHGVTRQPGFVLAVARQGQPLPTRIGEYRADFVYCECRSPDRCARQHIVVEDVKGYDTPLSKWKRKHVAAEYGIDVRVIR